jgi:orotate phosphoribosyltransferase
LLIEDTMTTGRSTLQALEAVRTHGAAVVGVLTVVNRSESAEAFYAEQGLPLISLFTGAELLEAARSEG